jgi:hypothetical protein
MRTTERRQFLAWCAHLPVLAALASHRATAAPVCANPDDLTSNEQALRTSLEYTDNSPDPQKTCSACSFFTRAGDDGCGKCQALNGPVNAKGRCSSFTLRK